MSRVDFYLLGGSLERCHRAACRVVEKAWAQGHRVVVRLGDDHAARAFDDLLWTWRGDAFVPHARSGTEEASDVEVLVAVDPCHDLACDVLVNLASDLPTHTSLPERVAEFVAGDDAARASGRERFRAYRALGCELLTHEL